MLKNRQNSAKSGRLLLGASGYFFLVFSPLVSARIIIHDDCGSTLFLQKPAKRIISLAPNLSEMLFYLNVKSQFIGRDANSNFPREISSIPVVAGYGKINIESIINRQPDLVLIEDYPGIRNTVETLKRFGVTVYVSRTQNLQEISRTLTNISAMTGNTQFAQEKIMNFKREFIELRKQYRQKKPLKVFYELWDTPLLTVNHNTLIHEVINLCGGENIFASTHSSAPKVSMESVLRKNPDVILSSIPLQKLQKQWASWSQINAVSKNNIFLIESDLIERPGPRSIVGARRICTVLDLARSEQLH